MIIVVLFSTAVKGQVLNNWDSLNGLYREKKLDDTGYMNSIRETATNNFKDLSLKEYLELYKKIAWSEKRYYAYRVAYYSMLASNASLTYRDGAGIYYLQKLEEELQKKLPYTPSLNEPRLLLVIYGKNETVNYQKRKEIFNSVLPFLKTLPGLILQQPVSHITCVNAMTILNMASRLYTNLSDTMMIEEVVNLSEKIWEGIRLKNVLAKDKMQQCLYLYYQVKYTAALMYKDLAAAREMLEQSYRLIRADTAVNQVWIKSVERALLRKHIDFFIEQGRQDSSRYYLEQLLQQVKKGDMDDGVARRLYMAKVNAQEKKFEQAYFDLLKAYELNDSAINLRTADINNNLYSQLMAVQKNEEIIRLEEQKQKRNIIVIGISFVLAISIVLLIKHFRLKDKKARKKIETINRLTQMEIAELETKANLIQRNLGTELHNDIAGRLVYLSNYIDKILLDKTGEEQAGELQRIRDLVSETYLYTRRKSHDWYSEGLKEEQQSFSESIHKLAAYALPDQQYEKEIAIDDNSMQKISYKVRTELLRILQEAFVNLLKHSGASKMQLYIYEEDNSIIVQVKDNGKGFDPQRLTGQKGIGLQSLHNKVQDMKGTFNIFSSAQGTELIVAIPV